MGSKVKHHTGGLSFWCPGCGESHSINTGGSRGPQWGYNGNDAAPTITPSIAVRSGHYAQGYSGGGCWCDYNREHPEDATFSCAVCHSFVTDGRIQFLGDCTHALAGQTVALPDWKE